MVFNNALSGSKVGVVSNIPLFLAIETDAGDVAKHRRRKQEFAGPNIRRASKLGTGDDLFHAKFDFAFEGHGGRHGNHGTRLGSEGASHGKLNGKDGVAVAVADAVASSVKCANIIVCRNGADKGRSWYGRLAQGPTSVRLLLLLLLL